MIKSFFKIALRNMWSNKNYSLLNFLCLTFGLTSAIISILYILYVFSYDKFHKNYSRIYSIDAYVTYFNGDRFPKEYLSASLTDVLKEQTPEIEETTRIAERDYSFISGNKEFTEQGIYADDNFFKIFSFPIVQSDSKSMLNDLNSILISERMAKKIFDGNNCTGNTLILKNGKSNEAYKVAGVFYDVPGQSLLQFDFIIPFSKFLADNKWALETGATSNEIWVLLKNNSDPGLVEKKIKNLIKSQETTLNQELFLFPLKEHILYSYAAGKRIWKEMQNLVIIFTIGLVILLIACFNYINLTIAINFRRYREAGIKKVAGAGKLNIVFQFLGETFIFTLISLLTAVILVRILLPAINTILNFQINLQLLDLQMVVFFIAITLFTALISGLLPALNMASSKPVDTLKGNKITRHSYSIFRQSLIVFQFTIPVVLIICMMIIRTQDSYMRNFDAGVDKEKVIVLDNTVNIQNHAGSFKAELLAIPGIEAVSFTNCIPTRGARVSVELNWEGKDVTEKLHFWCVNTDIDYSKVVSVKMVEGRFFDQAFSADSASYLINDVAARVIKIEKPVGTTITLDGQKGTIIGVFKDFHSIDLAGPLVPTIMSLKSFEHPFILIKYSSASFQSINRMIGEVYRNYEPEATYKGTLFRNLAPFSDLSLPSKLAGLAFIIALLLACMGLSGLASFTSENRTREIGLRKAHGATSLSVMRLLLTGYVKWLATSFIIALPIAFLLGRNFLGRFYFHAPMPLWTFIAGPGFAFLVALLTVSLQTLRVANRNPVLALRYD
jgi:putative ABC transport system permease protein